MFIHEAYLASIDVNHQIQSFPMLYSKASFPLYIMLNCKNRPSQDWSRNGSYQKSFLAYPTYSWNIKFRSRKHVNLLVSDVTRMEARRKAHFPVSEHRCRWQEAKRLREHTIYCKVHELISHLIYLSNPYSFFFTWSCKDCGLLCIQLGLAPLNF